MSAALTPYDVRLLAGHGYIVFRPDTRGAGARTEEGPLSGMDTRVLRGMDALIAKGYADGTRFGLTGFSQGGFASLWLAARSDRFRAVVSVNGWSDMYTQYFEPNWLQELAPNELQNWGDAGRYEATRGTQFGMGVTPWLAPERYVRNSPLFRAPDISASVLLIHSDWDQFRAHQYQMMFSALYRQRKEAALMTYRGEGHGPSSPANIRHMWKSIFEWFDKFLDETQASTNPSPLAGDLPYLLTRTTSENFHRAPCNLLETRASAGPRQPGLGPGISVYAAQAVAGRGIAVLQIQDKYVPGVSEGVNEARLYMGTFEAAVKYLSDMGIVDAKRVGLMGHSRMGWKVEYALSHSDFPYAAAIASDNMDAGYFQAGVMLWMPEYGADPNGAPPFGEGLAIRMENSPAFNVEKIRTPLLLISTTSTGGLTSLIAHGWEMFSRLRYLNKPVEWFVIPDLEHGSHTIQNPRQCLTAQERAVDWWDFWLNGREDPSPIKRTQYQNWRRLRELQSQQTGAAGH